MCTGLRNLECYSNYPGLATNVPIHWNKTVLGKLPGDCAWSPRWWCALGKLAPPEPANVCCRFTGTWSARTKGCFGMKHYNTDVAFFELCCFLSRILFCTLMIENVWFFWPTSASQITLSGQDRYKSTSSLDTWTFWISTSSPVGVSNAVFQSQTRSDLLLYEEKRLMNDLIASPDQLDRRQTIHQIKTNHDDFLFALTLWSLETCRTSFFPSLCRTPCSEVHASRTPCGEVHVKVANVESWKSTRTMLIMFIHQHLKTRL